MKIGEIYIWWDNKSKFRAVIFGYSGEKVTSSATLHGCKMTYLFNSRNYSFMKIGTSFLPPTGQNLQIL